MKRKSMRVVEDFMSSAVISVKESQTMRDVDSEMSLADIRHMPVTDGRGHVTGVLSQRDVIRALSKGGDKGVLVSQVMTRPVRTVRPSTPAHEAAALMLENKIGCLPVIGDEEQLVGIITETDFLSIAEQALRGVDVQRAPED